MEQRGQAVQSDRDHHGHRDRGFTLIELLVVVIIVGVLAGIAVPVYLNQRQKAYVKATAADARQYGRLLDVAVQERGPTTNIATLQTTANADMKWSPDNSTYYLFRTLPNTGPTVTTSVVFCVVHRSGSVMDASATYSTGSGGLVRSGPKPCPDYTAILAGGDEPDEVKGVYDVIVAHYDS